MEQSTKCLAQGSQTCRCSKGKGHATLIFYQGKSQIHKFLQLRGTKGSRTMFAILNQPRTEMGGTQTCRCLMEEGHAPLDPFCRHRSTSMCQWILFAGIGPHVCSARSFLPASVHIRPVGDAIQRGCSCQALCTKCVMQTNFPLLTKNSSGHLKIIRVKAN